MKAMPRLLLPLVLLQPGCSKAMPPPIAQSNTVLSSASPQAVLPLTGKAERVILDLAEVVNPSGASVTIMAEDNGSPPKIDRFSLYPPDRPGRFSIRVSPGATELRVSLIQPKPAERPEITIRLRVAPEAR